MTGYVTQQRDLLNDGVKRFRPKTMPYTLKSGFVPFTFAPNTGPVVEDSVASLISHQRTRSFRSGGKDQSILEDAQQILVDNVQQFNWPFDNGHEYSTLKVFGFNNSHTNYVARGGLGAYYRGPLMAVDPVPFWTGHNSPDGHDRVTVNYPQLSTAIGTKFLRSTLPGKSTASLVQLITETIRDMPRIPFQSFDHRLFDRRNLPKNIGSEYLNTVFGWSPLVSDVLKVCEAIVNIDDAIRQYQRDAGPDRTVRRRRVTDEVRTTESSEVSDNIRIGFPYGPGGFYPGSDLFMDQSGGFPYQSNGYICTRGKLTLEVTTVQSYSFVARWMYYLGSDSPVFGELQRIAQLARKTLGIRLDLELLWELAPWTWLSDWFINIGDVLAVSSALAQYDQVLQYAYLTSRTEVLYQYSHTGVLFGSGYTGPISSSFIQTTEERVRATPYGFGVDLNGLNPQQLAILASLVASGHNGSKL